MLTAPMIFLTDFADQAVALPLMAVFALGLGALGWRRGALAWLAAAGGSLAAVLALKLVFLACGPALSSLPLRSPSGHAAVAALLAGGLAAVLGQSRSAVLGAAVVAAVLIGATRLALGLHSLPEVVLGGGLGIVGALGFDWLAGTAPALRLRWLFVGLLGMALLLHGWHLNAEARIRAAASGLPFCAGGQLRP